MAAATATRPDPHGVTVLVSAISPYRAVRDVKGLYAKQARGELQGLTGVDDPYEPPLAPELILDTAAEPPGASAARVLSLLDHRPAPARGRVAPSPAVGRAPDREGSRPREEGRTAVHSPRPHSPHPHSPDPHGGRLVERLVPDDRAEVLADGYRARGG